MWLKLLDISRLDIAIPYRFVIEEMTRYTGAILDLWLLVDVPIMINIQYSPN